MRTWCALPFVLCGFVLAGCDLYFGGGDDTVCNGGYKEGALPYYEYRDPTTGTCISAGGGGYCDGTCGPCPAATGVDGGRAAAQPDMGMCQSACTGLAEGTCQGTPGCYAAYFDDPAADGKRDYWGCWETAPSGPVQGTCANLDAHECSRHDDCSLVYSNGYNGTQFVACTSEPAAYCIDDGECGSGAHCDHTTCYTQPCSNCPTCGVCADVCYGVCVSDTPSCAAVDCGPGYRCEEQCYPADGPNVPTMGYCTTACVPDTGSCATTDCGPGYTCIDSCEYDGNGTLQCGPQCVPDNSGGPGSCYGDVLCDAIGPACPSGTTAGIANGCYTGYCIPNAACGPNDPGNCYGSVTCLSPSPACPANTTPGVANGCYTGYCIPTSQCPLQACETLSSEAACEARGDCTTVFTGTNCTCTPNGCTCETLSYNRCESLYMPL